MIEQKAPTAPELTIPLTPPAGLTEAQVLENRARFGSNALPSTKRTPWWRQYLEGFTDPTIVLLLASATLAMTLSLISGKTPLDGIGILVAVFIATTVNFVNEYRAEADFERLKSEFERNIAIVTRAGQEQKLTFDQVVVGDLVSLSTGSLMPADGTLVKSANLMIDTAPIDGESAPKEKGIGGDDPEYSQMLRGYRVTEGTGQMVVSAVGTRTAMWVHIIDRMQKAQEDERGQRTPLQERLDGLASIIGRVGIVAALLIFGTLIARSLIVLASGHDLTLRGDIVNVGLNGPSLLLLTEYILVAVTVVVVAVPEGLPLAVTVSLSLSARQIANDHNLVRKPKAIETIGQTNVICTDKTGTLTENRMVVERVYIGGESFHRDRITKLKDHEVFPLVAMSAALNSTAALNKKPDGWIEYLGNATEAALLAWIDSNGESYRKLREDIRLDEQGAFNSTSKIMTSRATRGDESFAFIKGAPEIVVAWCTSIQTAEGPKPIRDYRVAIDAELEAMSSEAMRTLALAYAPIPSSEMDHSVDGVSSNTTLLGIFGLADPVRAEVPEALKLCRTAGIEVKMITGDNVLTAQAIAKQLGLVDGPDQVYQAKDLRTMPLEQRRVAARKLRVMARAIPSDKEDLVQLLQEERQVVAVTGDGVNDGPALQRADVGIAMGIRGTDIAKQASDLVLLDDNFRSIVRAVHWGRALYENIQRFLQFQLTINVSALAIVFLATLFGLTPEPGETPLTVIQLLWINLIMDTLAVLALCLEPPTREQMHYPPKGRTEPFITRTMMANIAVMSTYFTTAILGLLALLNRDGHFDLTDSAILFSVYVFFQIFNEINARSLDPNRSPFRGIFRNRTFIAVIVLIAIVQIVITQIGGPVGENIFRTTPLRLETWLYIVLGTATALVVGEVVRQIRKIRTPNPVRAVQ